MARDSARPPGPASPGEAAEPLLASKQKAPDPSRVSALRGRSQRLVVGPTLPQPAHFAHFRTSVTNLCRQFRLRTNRGYVEPAENLLAGVSPDYRWPRVSPRPRSQRHRSALRRKRTSSDGSRSASSTAPLTSPSFASKTPAPRSAGPAVDEHPHPGTQPAEERFSCRGQRCTGGEAPLLPPRLTGALQR